MLDTFMPSYPWQSYKTGGKDNADRDIQHVHALDSNYVLYFAEDELFYETTPELLAKLGAADLALARINRLLPLANFKSKNQNYYQKRDTLEQVADAYEMIFCGHDSEGLLILNEICSKLQAAAEGKRRLWYQLGTIVVSASVWVLYLWLHQTKNMPEGWEPWALASALGVAGGTFSVCLNLASLQVSIDQQIRLLFFTGATRSIVALLSGIGLLLALRAKMIAGVAYGAQPPQAAESLQMVEMFFCFVAGFSETFVPNILRDSEKNPSGSGKPANPPKTPDQPKPADQPK